VEIKLIHNENGYNNIIITTPGIAKIFNNLLGNKEKKTLGRNSANNKTKKEDITTCINKTKNGTTIIYFSIIGSNKLAI